MKRFETVGWLILAMSLAATSDADTPTAAADSQNRSYRSIIERNPFALKDPPPPPQPPAGPPTNAPPKGILKLTGLGIKRAFFQWTDERTRTNETFTLAVNQRREDLEVLSIDEKARAVKVHHQGKEKLLTFATDGITNLVAGAMAVAMPGGIPGGGMALPGMPGVPGVLGGRGAPVPQPMNTARPTTSIGAPSGFTRSAVSPGASAIPTVRPIPSRTVRTPTQTDFLQGNQNQFGGVNDGVAQPQHNLSAEQQIILMEAQRMINPTFPPTPGLPPPPLPGTPQ